MSCSGDAPSDSDAGGVLVTAQGRADDAVHIIGSFNNWQRTTPMIFRDGRWEITLTLPPGDYPYAFYSATHDTQWLDEDNPLTMFESGVRYSRLMVKDPRYPSFSVTAGPVRKSDGFSVTISFHPGINNTPMDRRSLSVLLNGVPVAASVDDGGDITVTTTGRSPGKYAAVVSAKDTDGFAADPLFVPVWVGYDRSSWKNGVIYQIMTDRFNDGDPENNNPLPDVPDKSNWNGGDFRGIIEKIESGYFTDLGVTVLWISSPVVNTSQSWHGMGDDTKRYSAYHSYWPVGSGWTDITPLPGYDSVVEPHFGSSDDLQKLMRTAHEAGLRVMFDIVPNHVHTDSNLWRTHAFDGWFHKAHGDLLPNENGGYTCGWERPVECWFTEYLADIDYRNITAMNTMMDHILWLIREFNVDGLRIDAVRLMRVDFIRTLQYFIQNEVVTTGIPFYMIGETFTDDTGWDEIGYYIGTDRLDGQFDFPLFHHVSRTFLSGSESVPAFVSFLDDHETRYRDNYYEDALMGTFIGNHDICRALSVANDDFDGSSLGGAAAHDRVWDNEPVLPETENPFRRLRTAHTVLFSMPGIPVIYQGDEFGMPGANDPDNRRMMLFDDELSGHQQQTLEYVKTVSAFRNSHPALRQGVRHDLMVSDTIWVTARTLDDDRVLLLHNTAETPQTVTVDISGVFPDNTRLTELFSQQTVDVKTGMITHELDGLTSVVLYRE